MDEDIKNVAIYTGGHLIKNVTEHYAAQYGKSKLVNIGGGLLATVASIYAEDTIGSDASVVLAVAGTGLVTNELFSMVQGYLPEMGMRRMAAPTMMPPIANSIKQNMITPVIY